MPLMMRMALGYIYKERVNDSMIADNFKISTISVVHSSSGCQYLSLFSLMVQKSCILTAVRVVKHGTE